MPSMQYPKTNLHVNLSNKGSVRDLGLDLSLTDRYYKYCLTIVIKMSFGSLFFVASHLVSTYPSIAASCYSTKLSTIQYYQSNLKMLLGRKTKV